MKDPRAKLSGGERGARRCVATHRAAPSPRGKKAGKPIANRANPFTELADNASNLGLIPP
jgi:hypothetical protein